MTASVTAILLSLGLTAQSPCQGGRCALPPRAYYRAYVSAPAQVRDYAPAPAGSACSGMRCSVSAYSAPRRRLFGRLFRCGGG